MGCMEPLSQPGGFCTRCGFNNSNNNHAHQLPIFTLLNGKYMVGRALGEGGFGITYIGIDIHLDVKIIIKETPVTISAFKIGILFKNKTA